MTDRGTGEAKPESLESQLLTVLQREAATHARHDARVDALERERGEARKAEADIGAKLFDARSDLAAALVRLARMEQERDGARAMLANNAEVHCIISDRFQATNDDLIKERIVSTAALARLAKAIEALSEIAALEQGTRAGGPSDTDDLKQYADIAERAVEIASTAIAELEKP